MAKTGKFRFYWRVSFWLTRGPDVTENQIVQFRQLKILSGKQNYIVDSMQAITGRKLPQVIFRISRTLKIL